MAQTLSSETATLFVWIVNASLVALVAALAVVLFADAVSATGSGRWPVARRFAQARLGRMLVRWDIDRNAYVRGLALPELRAQLVACRDCACTTRCDAFLASTAAANESLAFCPNARALVNFSRHVPLQLPGL